MDSLRTMTKTISLSEGISHARLGIVGGIAFSLPSLFGYDIEAVSLICFFVATLLSMMLHR
jgi:hypothetical protein